jgi:hypothetical protein
MAFIHPFIGINHTVCPKTRLGSRFDFFLGIHTADAYLNNWAKRFYPGHYAGMIVFAPFVGIAQVTCALFVVQKIFKFMGVCLNSPMLHYAHLQ